MEEYQLSQSSFRRATADTIHAPRQNPWFFWSIGLIITALGAVLGNVYTPESNDKLLCAIYPTAGGILGAIIGIILIFIINLISAPYKQRSEAREAVKILAFATQPTEIVRSLLGFYDEATRLMMRKIATEEELEVMMKDVDDWWKHCRQWVKENVSVAEWVLFSRVVANPAMKFGEAYNDLHNKRLEFLHYASEQLKQLIIRFQQAHQIKGQ